MLHGPCLSLLQAGRPESLQRYDSINSKPLGSVVLEDVSHLLQEALLTQQAPLGPSWTSGSVESLFRAALPTELRSPAANFKSLETRSKSPRRLLRARSTTLCSSKLLSAASFASTGLQTLFQKLKATSLRITACPEADTKISWPVAGCAVKPGLAQARRNHT